MTEEIKVQRLDRKEQSGKGVERLPSLEGDGGNDETLEQMPEMDIPEFDIEKPEPKRTGGVNRAAIERQKRQELEELGLDGDTLDTLLPHTVKREVEAQKRQIERERNLKLAETLGIGDQQVKGFVEAKKIARQHMDKFGFEPEVFDECTTPTEAVEAARRELRFLTEDYPRIKKLLTLKKAEEEGADDVSTVQSHAPTDGPPAMRHDNLGDAPLTGRNDWSYASLDREKAALRKLAQNPRAKSRDKRAARIRLLEIEREQANKPRIKEARM